MLRYQTQVEREAALEHTQTVASVMDDAFRVPSTDIRFGLDPVLGVVPVSGDAVAALAALYVVFQAVRVGVPKRTLASMLCWVALDFVVGSVPLVGPLFDARLRVNQRNTRAMATHVDRQGR